MCVRKYVCRSSQVEKGLADVSNPSSNGHNSGYGCSALHMSLRITNLSPEQWQGAMCNQQGADAKAVARRIDYDTIPRLLTKPTRPCAEPDVAIQAACICVRQRQSE